MNFDATKSTLRSLKRRLVNTILFGVDPPRDCLSTREWVRENPPAEAHYIPIDPPHTIKRCPPRTVEATVHSKFTRELLTEVPASYVAVIPYGRVFGHHGAIITPDNRLLRDVSIDFGAPQDRHFALARGNLPKVKKINGKSAVLASKGARHYFHWLFDALPRLDMLQRSGIAVDHYLIPKPKAFHYEYLDLFGIPPKHVIPLEKDSHAEVEQLILPSLPSRTGVVTRRSCDFLRKTVFKVITPPVTLSTHRRLYISRSQAEKRKVLNEDKVIQALESYGFRTIVLEALSVVEQVTAFASADIIVAPHGAGLSNLVYCRPGTQVIECFSPQYVNVCYWGLCEQLKLPYFYIIGEGPHLPEGTDANQVGTPISISLQVLDQTLKTLLG